jgi:hydroxymethylbilane synthase
VVSRPIRIASRGSELALWQARAVGRALRAEDAGANVEIRVIRTTGDRVLDVPLARIGDRGLFTKEIDAALLNGEADLAVHSLKDVPTELPAGLTLAAVTEREDPRDVLICRSDVPGGLRDLPPGSRVGTSSLRRRAQLRAQRPDLEVLDLRGNLNTRLAKLDDGQYEAILLAAAGVLRLGWVERISEYLDPASWLPAVGQGALAVITRADDEALQARLQPLHHAPTAACVAAERALLHALQGGCQVPIAALGRADGSDLHLDGLVADLDGTTILRTQEQGRWDDAERLGRQLASRLLEQGAGAVLAEVRRTSGGDAPPIPAP